MPPALVGELIAALAERFGIEPGAEISLEANPGGLDRRHAPINWLTVGFERVSFGSQSFDPGVLCVLGRRHRPETDRRGGGHSPEQSGFDRSTST